MKALKWLVVGIVVLAFVATWTHWFLGGVEVEWDYEVPKIRGIGEATERVLAADDGEPTDADRARAAERAVWKAYYYAQLRVAEQIGNLKIDGHTELNDLALVDQQLFVAYKGAVRAAREVEAERKIEMAGNAVRARVVAEVPDAHVNSLRASVSQLLRASSIRIQRTSLSRSGLATITGSPRGAEIAVPAEDRPTLSVPQAPPYARAPPLDPAPAPTRRRDNRAPPVRPAYTGYVVHVEDGVELGAFPSIYDAAGTVLAEPYDLPVERVVAAFPTVLASELHAAAEWAGGSPRSLTASVSQGDLFLREQLQPEEARAFRTAVQMGRVVLVVGGELSK